LDVFCWEDDLDITGGDTTLPWHSRWDGWHAAIRAKSPWYGSSDWKGDWVTQGGDFDMEYGDTIYYKGNPAKKWMRYDITDMVQFFVDNPSQNYGLVISVELIPMWIR
jgi:hypothetical protein